MHRNLSSSPAWQAHILVPAASVALTGATMCRTTWPCWAFVFCELCFLVLRTSGDVWSFWAFLGGLLGVSFYFFNRVFKQIQGFPSFALRASATDWDSASLKDEPEECPYRAEPRLGCVVNGWDYTEKHAMLKYAFLAIWRQFLGDSEKFSFYIPAYSLGCRMDFQNQVI